jgi:hypothetical protein
VLPQDLQPVLPLQQQRFQRKFGLPLQRRSVHRQLLLVALPLHAQAPKGRMYVYHVPRCDKHCTLELWVAQQAQE